MGFVAVIKELINAGAEVDTAREVQYVNTYQQHFSCIFLFIQDGATPLFKAAHKGHETVVEILLDSKPNLGLLKNGESALHAACLFGHLSVAQTLVMAGANPHLRNKV